MTNEIAAYGKMMANFARSLRVRPDRARCCAVLADALIGHRDELWPKGGPESNPEWIADHVPGIVAHFASVFSVVAIICKETSADDWLVRMAWLPRLIQDLEARNGRLDA
ncbi:hypothetical protein [Reyranella sp.]|uniref:hypothetical protein n=1 Tax=Reyranella sp. TaxID=1929291 RepID=UPI003D12A4B0